MMEDEFPSGRVLSVQGGSCFSHGMAVSRIAWMMETSGMAMAWLWLLAEL
jgi:hypothetical protein